MSDYENPLRVVFDCMVFLQATANETSASAKALDLVDAETISLFVSDSILREVRDVLSRPEIREKIPQITDVRVNALLKRLSSKAILLVNIPNEFHYERDPKDEPYINLALAANAKYLVTRDKDLLDLMDETTEAGRTFRSRYPFLTITTPATFLQEIERGDEPERPEPELKP